MSINRILVALVLSLFLANCVSVKVPQKSPNFRLLEAYSAHWRGGAVKSEGTIYNLKIEIQKHDPTLTFDCMWIGEEYMSIDARRPFNESSLPVTKGSVYNIRTIKSIENTGEEEGSRPLPAKFKGYKGVAIFQYSVKNQAKFLLIKGFDAE